MKRCALSKAARYLPRCSRRVSAVKSDHRQIAIVNMLRFVSWPRDEIRAGGQSSVTPYTMYGYPPIRAVQEGGR